MLYLSTRNRTDSFTAYYALHTDRAPDGGLFIPNQLPHFSRKEILQFSKQTFGETVAQILNIFFSAKVTGWDVEFCCGRNPIQTKSLPRRLIIGELWHNTAASYSYIEQAIYNKLCGEKKETEVTEWARIAIQVALLFAVYGAADGSRTVDSIDIALDADGFITPTAAWYAREMGLPLRTIICGNEDTSVVWDLLHRGETSTASAAGELLGLERLVYHNLGLVDSLTFVQTCLERKFYHLTEEQQNVLNAGFFAAVVSSSRVPSVIDSFHRSHGYAMDPFAAIGYGALQDYRAKTGESRETLLLSVRQPG